MTYFLILGVVHVGKNWHQIILLLHLDYETNLTTVRYRPGFLQPNTLHLADTWKVFKHWIRCGKIYSTLSENIKPPKSSVIPVALCGFQAQTSTGDLGLIQSDPVLRSPPPNWGQGRPSRNLHLSAQVGGGGIMRRRGGQIKGWHRPCCGVAIWWTVGTPTLEQQETRQVIHTTEKTKISTHKLVYAEARVHLCSLAIVGAGITFLAVYSAENIRVSY